jgi:hypothetical protein
LGVAGVIGRVVEFNPDFPFGANIDVELPMATQKWFSLTSAHHVDFARFDSPSFGVELKNEVGLDWMKLYAHVLVWQ